MKHVPPRPGPPRGRQGAAFLVAQVGAHAAAKFAERLADFDLTPPQAGILRALSASPGISQQELGRLLGIFPSRLVLLLDELDELGLIERRDDPDDRRVYQVFVTDKGRQSLEAIGRIARAHQDALCAALDEDERQTLASLLSRIAEEQGLTPGVHPGFAKMGRPPAGPHSKRPRKT
ncbi:Transcriptional regulator, MarR family [Labilithrix luteola]|uniref:Transcriptional regulator, MarR family n=1 Tax=Labilithrix luteola TaxID=1391654 RepID=A0A0K1PLZ0_9BACT|nr:MarR family winged helix-turn-helix transcriptional regulator [Labilithrix luteola]AKU94540.1 Transcriptional regulator, MarR family [Labilithrix luteola]